MLALTRRQDEIVTIGDDIRVRVLCSSQRADSALLEVNRQGVKQLVAMRSGDRKVIASDITIVLARLLSCGRVRLGIDAPPSIAIKRVEERGAQGAGRPRGHVGTAVDRRNGPL